MAREIAPDSYAARTSHRNPHQRPNIGLGDSAQWCGVCHCWDIALVEDLGGRYSHPTHWVEVAGETLVVHRAAPNQKGADHA